MFSLVCVPFCIGGSTCENLKIVIYLSYTRVYGEPRLLFIVLFIVSNSVKNAIYRLLNLS